MAVVVFPTPPFWFAIAIVLGTRIPTVFVSATILDWVGAALSTSCKSYHAVVMFHVKQDFQSHIIVPRETTNGFPCTLAGKLVGVTGVQVLSPRHSNTHPTPSGQPE